jgi:hypothetical protein
VETQPTLVRADRAVHLDAIPFVDVNVSGVVHPRYAEHHHALRFDDAIEYVRRLVLRIGFDDRPNRVNDFMDRLMKFRFGGILGDDLVHKLVDRPVNGIALISFLEKEFCAKRDHDVPPKIEARLTVISVPVNSDFAGNTSY